MNFKDKAIILSKRLLQEKSYIVTVFTENHGIYSGVIKQFSKKTGDNLVEGNLVDFLWSARLHEHVGYAKIEIIKSYNSYIISNKVKLYAFNSIVGLLKLSFCEREPHNNLFPALLDLIKSFKKEFSIKEYINFELSILAEAGYQLQLDRCAVTGKSDDLYYVSPKSGKAVSKKEGLPFASKMLILPQFLITNKAPNKDEIKASWELTSYFIQRYILLGKEEPSSRNIFYNHILHN